MLNKLLHLIKLARKVKIIIIWIININVFMLYLQTLEIIKINLIKIKKSKNDYLDVFTQDFNSNLNFESNYIEKQNNNIINDNTYSTN